MEGSIVKDYRLMKNRGITLIALVVTIIVLLILAGISISMLTGQNGILNRASEAKEKTSLSQKQENTVLTEYEDLINSQQKENDRIYAILDSNGTLVLSNTNDIENASNCKKTYGVLNDGYDKKIDIPWYNDREEIVNVKFENQIYPKDMTFWFSDCINLKTIENFEYLRTINVTSIKALFYNCQSMENINIKEWNTANIVNMNNTFMRLH